MMYHMRKATVRDLRYDFKKIEKLLREGQEIQITKRGRPIGRLTPEPANGTPKMPDFMARMREIYGNNVLKVSGAELVAWDRDRGY